MRISQVMIHRRDILQEDIKCKHFLFFQELGKISWNVEVKLLVPSEGVVYGVCHDISSWPCMKDGENSEEVYFGLKTGEGSFGVQVLE